MAEQMGDQAKIPPPPACGQWETLLVDVMDGLLRPEDEAAFSGHMAICPRCAEMFEQVRRGREWLEFLAPEPEVPAYLLDKILVETGHGKLDPSKLVVAGGPENGLGVSGNVLTMVPAWQRPGFAGRMRRFAEPRLLMTAAMAFFSIALTLSMTGVRLSGVKMADLRPTVLRTQIEKRIMTASTPIVRYYDHLRFVYEVESRMRELRRSTESEQQNQPPAHNQPQPGGEGETHRKDGGSKLNPSNAPQQTVNPPSPLWSGEALEARFEPLPRFQPLNQEPNEERTTRSKGYSTQTERSASINASLTEATLITTDSIERHVLAMPDRGTPCIA